MPFEIKQPNTGVILQVAECDFSEEITFEKACQICKDLGNGWRLPTSLELELMYEQLHKNGKGSFKDTGYWESSGRTFNFNYGRCLPRVKQQRIQGFYYPPEMNHMRAVLSLHKPFGLSRLFRW